MRLIDADILKSAIIAMDYLSETNLNFICKAIDNAPTVDLKDIYQEGHYDGHLEGYTKAINEERPQGKWFDCIEAGTLKARHGDYVLYKVDFLLDNLTREVYIMEGARRMRGKEE